MKNFNLKQLLSKLSSLFKILQRYAVIVFIVVVVGVYGFLVMRINSLARTEPSDAAVTEKLQTVKRPKIDQSALDKIQRLQGQNVEVKSLFDHARDNPFQE